eukprot:symbB.v1.2.009683.t2/scaffold620.1/size179776/1
MEEKEVDDSDSSDEYYEQEPPTHIKERLAGLQPRLGVRQDRTNLPAMTGGTLGALEHHVSPISFFSDTEGAKLNEAMHLPGGDPEDGLPDGPDDVADPHVPRKLLDEHLLRDKTVKTFSPYGLRVLGRRLFVCDSNKDEDLEVREYDMFS